MLWIILLLLPVGTPVWFDIDDDELEELCIPMKEFAYRYQYMDPKQAQWYFTDPSQFQADLDWLRGSIRSLHDAPYVEDSGRFPSAEWCMTQIELNSAYNLWLYNQECLNQDRIEPYRQARKENGLLYDVYIVAHDINTDYLWIPIRRTRLKELREKIGIEAYNTGVLPPSVPIWRFNEQ